MRKIVTKAAPAPVGMAQLLTNLAAVRAEIAKNGLSDDQVDRLAERETAAVIAIARARAATVHDFTAKLRLMFDYEAADLNCFDGCPDFRALKRGLLADATRLFGGGDERLFSLLEERRHLAGEVEAIGVEGDRLYAQVHAKFPAFKLSKSPAGHPDHRAFNAALDAAGEPDRETRLNEALDRKFANEKAIAKTKVRSLAGLAALIKITALPVNGDEQMGIVNEEVHARILRNLAEFAATVSAPPAIARPAALLRKAA